MPLDTRIALGAQPLQIESPLAQYGQAVGIQNAMQQNQLAQMQMSAAQRTMQEEEGLKNYLTDPKTDLTTAQGVQGAMRFGAKGLAYAKAIAEQKKAGLEGDKLAAEILGANQKNFTALNSPMNAAARGPAGITDYVEALYKDPVLGPLAARVKSREQALAENQLLYQKSPEQWVMAHANLDGQHLLDALKKSAEKEAERARIASLPPLPAAAPTGTVSDTRAALVAPGAAAAAPAPIVTIAPDLRLSSAVIAEATSNPNSTAARMLIKMKEQPNLYKLDLASDSYYELAPDGQVVAKRMPDNHLAAAVAPAPAAAASVNALASNEATLQAISAESKKLTDRLEVLNRLPFSKGVEREIKDKEARLKELNAPINLRADGTSIIPGKGTLIAAAAPSDILRMQREAAALRASGDIAGADAIANRIKKLNELADNRTAAQKEQAILDDPKSTAAQKATATSQLAKLNQLTDNRTAAQKEQAILDDPNATPAQKAIATSQLAKLNQLADNRTETQKEVAVLVDPNASQAAKDAATKRIAKLVDIPAKSVDGAIERYEYAVKNSGYKGTFTDFIVLSTPKTTITNTMKTEGAYGTALAGKIADEDAALRVSAKKAPNLADNANRVLSILDQGNVFVGPAATIKLNLARVLNAAGANNDEKIANTETLISSLGRNTLGMVKESGLGTAQGFTDKDLQFLERIAGSSIDYNAQTLRNLTELAHKAAEASAEAWNKRVKEIPASAVGGTNISIEPVVVPARVTKAAAATRPAGVPAEWTLQIDANGKKAYVSPDGKSFKEVP